MSRHLQSGPALRVVMRPEHPSAGEPDDREGEAPLDKLYRRFAPYVAAVASRILGRQQEVEDVVQDVFVAAVRGLKITDDVQQTKSWLVRVTVRRSLRQLRKRALWTLLDLAEPAQYERLADPAAGPEERRLIAEVYRALDRVPPKERIAWILRYVQGESLEDAAVSCECSLATVKRRVAAAHQIVTSQLSGGDYGH